MKLTVEQMQAMSNEDAFAKGFRWWDGKLMLIPEDLFNSIADGETLTCIDGTTAVKGRDEIDLDTRGGLIAYGYMSLHPKEDAA